MAMVVDLFGSDEGFSLMKMRNGGGGLKKFNKHVANFRHKKAPDEGGFYD